MMISDDRGDWPSTSSNMQFGGTAPLRLGGAQAGAFLSTTGADRPPDIQVHFLPLSTRGKGWSFHRFSGITANVCQLRPFSRGRVSLGSANPETAPLIDPNYLSDIRDQETLLAGLRLARKIFMAPPFSPRLSAREVFPGPERTSDESLLSYARSGGTTVFTPSEHVVWERMTVRSSTLTSGCARQGISGSSTLR